MSDISFNPSELLWEQRYRPSTLTDCVLPDSLRSIFEGMVKQGDISNLLLSSYCPGTGKTTVAMALMNDLNYEYIFKAAGTGSGEGGIQAMRDIQEYASCISVTGRKKAVVIDEADNLTEDAQSALRNIIERYSKSIRFILTANYPEKLMRPLHSRLTEVVFEIKKDDEITMKRHMIRRCMMICKNENIEIQEPKALAALVNHFYPDNRSVVRSLQTYARRGPIDEGILATLTSGGDIGPIVAALKSKDFRVLRELAPQYKHNFSKLITELYRKMYQEIDPSCIPVFINIIGDANNNANSCADVEILIVYMFTLMLTEIKFK